MALTGYATGALRPSDWERTGRKRHGSEAFPEKPKAQPKSNLDGDLIDSEKLRKVIEVAEGTEE